MTLETSDPYEVLGVPAGSALDVVRQAYRRRARETHPDAGGSASAFRGVQAAWESLRFGPSRSAGDSEQPRRDHRGGEQQSPSAATAAGQPEEEPGWTEPARSPSWADLLDGVAAGPDEISVVPGRGAVWWRVALGVATVAWAVIGVWIGLPGVRVVTQIGVFPVSATWPPAGPLWSVVWLLGVVPVAWRGLWGSASGAIFVVAGLAVWAGFAVGPANPWVWMVGAWVVFAAVNPVIRTLLRPMWSHRQVRAGNVLGEPEWEHRVTGELVEELTVIPAVRVLHGVYGAAHVVVCGGYVAVVGDEPVAEVPFAVTRQWPLAIAEDPVFAVDQIARWLLSGSDGQTVDRRVLGSIHTL